MGTETDVEMALKVSKLDAAKRQLEMAIELFFMQRDPVSVHTLAAAAYQLLADLNEHRGGKPMLRDWETMKEYIVPGQEDAAKGLLRKAQNFFKHADRADDPDAILDFYPQQNVFMLWEAAVKYVQLTTEQTAPMQAIYMWFMLQHQDVFILEKLPKAVRDVSPHFRGITHLDFYRHFMAAKQNELEARS